MELNSYNTNYCAAAICTEQAIDITNYNKIRVIATVISNGDTSSDGGYLLGIKETKIGQTNNWETMVNSTEKTMTTGENLDIKLDISNNIGSYYIGIQDGRFLIKIHKIWLE